MSDIEPRDVIAFYAKLVAIKPFFEKVRPFDEGKTAFKTAREETLVETVGGVFKLDTEVAGGAIEKKSAKIYFY